MTHLAISLLVLLSLVARGQQNLVPNESFEEYTSCVPNSIFNVWLAVPWTNTDFQNCSPDYYNECCPPTSSGLPHFGVPENLTGVQHARTGDSYAGFYAYSWFNLDGREYVQVELMETLEAGINYEVTFHVSLADKFWYAVGSLGALFTDTMFTRSSYSITGLDLNPQIQSTAGVFFDDKDNWMEVRDTFVAQGGERFITIGNFNTDGESDTVMQATGEGLQYHAYYYIDDVSVVMVDTPVGVREQEELRFSIYPNPNNGRMTLTYTLKEREKGSVIIYSVLGEQILERPLDRAATVTEIDLGGVSSGIYLLRVDVNGSIKLLERMSVLRE